MFKRYRSFLLIGLMIFLLFVVPVVSASSSFLQDSPPSIEDVLNRLPPVSIGGIGLFGLVVAIVQLARRRFRFPTQYALPLAIALVVVSYGALIAVAVNPTLEAGVVSFLQILGVLLSVAGGPKLIYGGAKSAGFPGFK